MLSRFPTLFVAHGGGPMPLLGVDKETKAHLESVRSYLPAKPLAVLVVTAHWEASPVRVTSGQKPGMLYDYYGFPPESYEFRFEAPGDPELAATVRDLLLDKGVDCDLDADRDYDHGVFVPGLLAFPEADVPFVALSLHPSLDAGLHLEIGRALRPLRDRGVLILGSGMSFHNMRAFQLKKGRNAHQPKNSVGAAFDAALAETLVDSPSAEERNNKLAQWTTLPEARFAHPREEHLLPLMVCAGAADDHDTPSRIFHDSILGASVSAFQFAPNSSSSSSST